MLKEQISIEMKSQVVVVPKGAKLVKCFTRAGPVFWPCSEIGSSKQDCMEDFNSKLKESSAKFCEVEFSCDFLGLEVVEHLLSEMRPQGVKKDDIPKLLQLLTSLGTLVWFDEPGLRETVMLQPRRIAVVV